MVNPVNKDSLKDSRAWNKRIDDFLNNLSFTRSKFEPDLYLKQLEGKHIYVTLYFDDIFIIEIKNNDLVKKQLSKVFRIKDVGEAK